MVIKNDTFSNETAFLSCTHKVRKAEIKNLFATRFKDLRIKNGYTQSQLAKLLCISRSCLCAWERAVRMPEISDFCQICSIFNVSEDYLFGLADNNRDQLVCSDLIRCNKIIYLDVSKLEQSNLQLLTNFYNELLSSQLQEKLKDAN